MKMVIAPQFNYLSMMLPFSISREYFNQYNQMVKDYLWNGKKPRIKLQKLYITRTDGGLALPNVELYNMAFEMSKLVNHFKGEGADLGWVAIE